MVELKESKNLTNQGGVKGTKADLGMVEETSRCLARFAREFARLGQKKIDGGGVKRKG